MGVGEGLEELGNLTGHRPNVFLSSGKKMFIYITLITLWACRGTMILSFSFFHAVSPNSV